MVHFYESSIIMTKDNIYCKVFANEHPKGYVIAKPKYIPDNKIFSDKLPMRYLFGKCFCRLDMWIDNKELKKYLKDFKEKYPEYIYKSDLHNNWFFVVPENKIDVVYDAREGLKELMKIPVKHLDAHLKKIKSFVNFLLISGLDLNCFGITHSTLAGHYVSEKSDMNIVVFGKKNYWKLMKFLQSEKHPLLRWKTDKEWLEFRNGRRRSEFFNEEEFLYSMRRKKSEGFFDNTFFVIFGVEEPNETWEKWGEEKYTPLKLVTIEGEVTDNYNSIVRPGFYEIKNSKVIGGNFNLDIKKIVFHSRDYIMQADVGEKIKACGLLEKVQPKSGNPYYRVVIGYFDAYISGRNEKEYIKVVKNEG